MSVSDLRGPWPRSPMLPKKEALLAQGSAPETPMRETYTVHPKRRRILPESLLRPNAIVLRAITRHDTAAASRAQRFPRGVSALTLAQARVVAHDENEGHDGARALAPRGVDDGDFYRWLPRRRQIE
jgi:hypothetical protein